MRDFYLVLLEAKRFSNSWGGQEHQLTIGLPTGGYAQHVVVEKRFYDEVVAAFNKMNKDP